MLLLRDAPPAAKTLEALERVQRQVDTEADFAKKSARAVALWKAKPKKPFQDVKQQLKAMCAGVARCNYCEDSLGDEIEHIWPKSLFPGRAFVWANYCLACGPCNGPKSNRFALFKTTGATFAELEPAIDPGDGQPVLLDPRVDDALDFLVLDVLGTFAFVPRPGLSPRKRARAAFSCDVLGLNREDLKKARRRAAKTFEALLASYVAASPAERPDWREHLETSEHPTVWYELVRFSAQLPAFAGLLGKAPEARTWAVGRAA
jgi:uncharacterized protein (TIGR02646 family)